jgi:hypothetical protein
MKTETTYVTGLEPPKYTGLEPPKYQDVPLTDQDTKFTEDSGWRDVPFLVLFVLHFAGIGSLLMRQNLKRSGVIIGLGITGGDVPPEDRVFDFTPQVTM